MPRESIFSIKEIVRPTVVVSANGGDSFWNIVAPVKNPPPLPAMGKPEFACPFHRGIVVGEMCRNLAFRICSPTVHHAHLHSQAP